VNNLCESYITDEEWLNQGKADAWAGQPKQPPSHNSLAASMYDLGYSEGQIKHSPIVERSPYKGMVNNQNKASDTN
jgi:hypothetical protein